MPTPEQGCHQVKPPVVGARSAASVREDVGEGASGCSLEPWWLGSAPQCSAGNQRPELAWKQITVCVRQGVLQKRIFFFLPWTPRKETVLVPFWVEKVDLRLSENWQGVPDL